MALKGLLKLLVVILILPSGAIAATTAPKSVSPAPAYDDGYIALFNQHFHTRNAPVALEDIASARIYDSHFMGDKLDKAMISLTNADGTLAWGFAYRMISLNQMYRITHDPKYLQANLRCSQAVLAARDDRTGTKNFRGQILPAWTCSRYSDRGRTVFLVHTGMIIYPILDGILLAETSPQISSDTKSQFDQLLATVLQSLHLHDSQWRDGPAADEGYYVGHDQEQALEGKPLPVNRLSAIGRCLLTAWLITNDSQYHSKAIALGWYIKHRLPIGKDGAYYWPYSLSESPVSGTVNRTSIAGEDTSHATLTVSFPIMLAENKEVFNDDDMRRFARTVTNGFARLGNGVIFGDITGTPRNKPNYVTDPAGWLRLSRFDPDVKTRILPFYLNYDSPLPPEAIPSLMTVADKTTSTPAH